MSYDYRVVSVDRVVDGDTLDVTIDLGFRVTTQQRIRVLGIDTPERGEPQWAEATEFTKGWCDDRAGRMRIVTHKSDSFGRYLGQLYEASTGHVLSGDLLHAGLAKPYVR